MIKVKDNPRLIKPIRSFKGRISLVFVIKRWIIKYYKN
jgi:hypothetical protein